MPPRKSKADKKKLVQSKYKCELCDNRDRDKPIVACDKCNKWHHFECVNIVSISKKDTWFCPKCQNIEQAEKPKNSCELCVTPDNNEMIECDLCEKKYHFVCVDLKSYRGVQPWKCASCRGVLSSLLNVSNGTRQNDRQFGSSTTIPSQSQRQFDANLTFDIRSAEHRSLDRNTFYSRPESVQRTSMSHMSRRGVQVELDYVEELKKFQDKWNKEKEICELEYLQRKYEILREENDNGNRTDRSHYTREWVDKINVKLETKKDENIDVKELEKRFHQLWQAQNVTVRPPHLEMATEDDVKSKENPFLIPQYDIKKPIQPAMPVLTKTVEPTIATSQNVAADDQPVLGSNKVLQPPIASQQVLSREQIATRHVTSKDLPIFYGNPEQWSLFELEFNESTRMCGLTNGENLRRLSRCLRGTARDAVSDLLLEPDSVPEIMSTLKMLFGRPEIAIKSMLKKIRQHSNPKADNLNSMISFSLEVKNLSKKMERDSMRQYLSNPVLIQELVDKLPTIHKVDWARYIMNIPDNQITLSTLSQWLQKLLQAIIKITEFLPSKDEERKFDKKYQKSNSERVSLHREPNQKTEEQVYKSDNHMNPISNQTTPKQCKICSKSCRNLQDCDTFKSYQPSQRWKAVYDNQLCTRCLRRHSGICRVNKKCDVNGCSYKHHSLLHDDKKLGQEKSSSTAGEKIADPPKLAASHISLCEIVILRILPVKLYGNGISIETFAFFDEGATTTLIDQRLADILKLDGKQKSLCLLWSARIHRTEKNSRQVELMISSQSDTKLQLKLYGVKTVECLGIPGQRLNRDQLCKRFPYLQNVPFASYENGIPGILIGSNNAKIGVPIEVIEGGDFGPIAYKTKLGWTVHGPITEVDLQEVTQNHIYKVEECTCQHEYDETLHQSMKDYFSVENFGVQVPEALNKESKEDELAMEQLKRYTRRIQGRFETGLLWRNESISFPDSYGMAKRRLECMENRKPQAIQIIDSTIADYIKKGYARKLTKEELLQKVDKKWYLPIFTVTYPKKPEKQRMVFDAAAKTHGISLNSLLLKGPDQLVLLVDILRRFRERRYGISGDIREMYHQVQIRKDDQNCQRFLWRNGDKTKEPDTYVMNVMTFGSTCSPSSTQFIKNLNASEFSTKYPRASEAIIKNHYVDDLMDSEDTEEQLLQLVKDVTFLHKKLGFEIRNFLSNSKEVMKALGSQEMDSKNIVPDKNFGIERVLGMWWNINTDCFTFSLKFTPVNQEILSGQRLPTKRELLKILMSIFDPLGLISNFLVHLKILIQDVWRTNSHWDQTITTKEIIDSWFKWISILPKVEDAQIPRHYSFKLSTPSEQSIELHTFVDASEQAFGAVSYLRIEDPTGVDCSLMGSKSRVAPLKYLSIPRKELQSGLLGSRLATSLGSSQTLKINRRIFWTDSSTLLSWLRSDQRKYHQFVAHRVGEILENTNIIEWRWIPSKLNVADELTKWSKTLSFEIKNRWFNGPSFLYESENYWPLQNQSIDETQEEMKVIYAHNEINVFHIFKTENFSDWNRLVRTVGYVLRFISILKAKVRKESFNGTHLKRDELIQARFIIFRQAQYEGFPDEMVTLELNKIHGPNEQLAIHKSSSLYRCSPYLINFGVLRIHGRIELAENISQDTKRPIILPRKNEITKLLVDCYHRMFHHRNHETVINEIRQQFYIPKLRVVLKSIVTNDCQKCKNRRAVPQVPEMGILPFGRIAVGFQPFSYTGVDYFGPIYVMQGRSRVKRWGVLFTCLTIRAVHVEIAHKLDTECCIMCIRDFNVIRGPVSEFYSDRGTNFVGCENELQRELEAINKEQLATTFTTHHSRWNFNPPKASHMSGAWERMVRSVKTVLYDILPVRTPTDRMLRNLLMESVNVVNSRPLTYVPLDNYNDEALTPNHFIRPLHLSNKSLNLMKPPGDFQSESSILWSAWREVQRLTDKFWIRFIQEFLPMLTRRSKWFEPVKPLEINDIVLDIDEKNDRNVYHKAKVIQRVMGSNNQVRRVRVQYGNGSALWRPTSKLARLDIKPKESLTVVPNSQTGGTVAKGTNSRANSLENRTPEPINH